MVYYPVLLLKTTICLLERINNVLNSEQFLDIQKALDTDKNYMQICPWPLLFILYIYDNYIKSIA